MKKQELDIEGAIRLAPLHTNTSSRSMAATCSRKKLSTSFRSSRACKRPSRKSPSCHHVMMFSVLESAANVVPL